MPDEARPYQSLAIDQTRLHYRSGVRDVLLHMATGAGKTWVFCYIAKHASGPVLILVHGRKLVDQASKRLFRENTEHGVLMAGHWNVRPSARVQVASIDTLTSRALKPEAKIIIIDEAHLSLSESYTKFLAQYGPDTIILRVTATPYNEDGIPSDVVVKPISMLELIEQGYLVPPRYYVPTIPDLKGVRLSGGDYNNAQLAKALDKSDLIGNIVEHWIKLGQNRPTLCFAINVAHSKHIAAEFMRHNITARHIDADTPEAERDQAIEDLRTGALKILCNVNINATGVDIPWCEAIIEARPTKSYNLRTQQLGRGTRNYADRFHTKADFLVFDHAGNTLRHGFITDEPEAVLAKDVVKACKKKSESSVRLKLCKACFAAMRPSEAKCPGCGCDMTISPEVKLEKSGILRELKALSEDQEYAIQLRRDLKLKRKPDGTKYKRGWAWFRMKERFGEEIANRHFPRRVVPEWVGWSPTKAA